ncbi:hypothetical protein ACO1O0_004891 [Amphichorda felina]
MPSNPSSPHNQSTTSAPTTPRLVLLSFGAVAFVLIMSFLALHTDISLTTTSPLASPIPPSIPSIPSIPSLPDHLNITYPNPDIPLAPSPLPPPHHASDAHLIIPLILSLTRSSTFTLVSSLPLLADTFEPEGLLVLPPSRLILSCAEYTSPTIPYPDHAIINGTDRTPGTGHGHLQVFDLADGSLLADASISHPLSPEYHNGGIDYDGRAIYGVLSQRRPNSSATLYAADPFSLQPTTLLRHPTDHLGTLAVNPLRRRITALNWGSRQATAFPLKDSSSPTTTHPSHPVYNPSHFIDYQDCKFLGPHQGRHLMLCSGVTSLPGSSSSSGDDNNPHGETAATTGYVLGGIALVDTETLLPVFELPITLESGRGVRITMNPFDVAVEDGRLRFYWAPDQHNTTLYVYEAQP